MVTLRDRENHDYEIGRKGLIHQYESRFWGVAHYTGQIAHEQMHIFHKSIILVV